MNQLCLSENLFRFMAKTENVFVVGDHPPTKFIYYNEVATTHFSLEKEGTQDLSYFYSMIQRNNPTFSEKIQQFLSEATEKQEEKSISLNPVFVTKSNHSEELCHVTFHYFPPPSPQESGEVMLQIVPYEDTRMVMTQHLVRQSTRPEAIFTFDDKMTFIFGNDPYYQLMDGYKDSPQGEYNPCCNPFLLQEQEALCLEIQRNLIGTRHYYTEVEIMTISGNRKWLAIDVQKRMIDDAGDKLICFFTSIQERMEKTEEVSLLNQYLSVMQKSTADILYRVDVTTNTMYHFSDFISKSGMENIIPDYVNVFMKGNIIHPEDKEAYMENFRLFYENNMEPPLPVRFSLGGKPYQWYKITGMKIFDRFGVLKEVFGALINVHQVHTMEDEVSALNQYFDVLQSVSGESFFVIDVKNKVLSQKGQVADELGFFTDVPDFPESIFYRVHPTDLPRYKEFIYGAMNGTEDSIEIRVKTPEENYLWYEITAKVLLDDKGTVEEVVGKMNNIQDEKVMEEEVSTLSQYFQAVQCLSGESLYTVDIKTRVLWCQGIAADELGLPLITEGYPESVYYLIHPDDIDGFKEFASHSVEGNESSVQIRIKNIDGSYQWYELLNLIIRNEKGEPMEILGKIKNIQGDYNMKTQYSTLNQYFSALQALNSDILFHIDVKTKTLTHSHGKAVQLGIPIEVPDFVETFIAKKFVLPEKADLYREYLLQLFSGQAMDFELELIVAPEEYQWFKMKSQFILDENGETSEVFGTLHNIQYEKDLENKANYDGLTSVRNISSFEAEVRRELKLPENAVHHALLFIDMDDFKYVNDNFGHQFGDFILENFAKRLKNCIRDTDMIGRLGGDEFVVYLKGVFDENMAIDRANTILERLKPPLANGKHSHVQGASIGIALIPETGITYEKLYENADHAVYHSKKRGKNMVTVFSDTLV